MPIDITSANSKLRIVVPQLFPGGFDVDDYAVDAMWSTEAVQNAEDAMSADGKYHAGYVFNPVPFTINLMPTSNAGRLIDQLWSAERTAIAKFQVNAYLTIPSLDADYQMVNGIVYSWNPMPDGARVLRPRAAQFRFENTTRK